ncbi:uncharacterized protein DEA37_0007622 [Paragonimus westermani]|uniref:Uncharacterized protein n=1 Tax=Paragonimus westermani TaxID=34504 RepID=A0A5J4NSU9_9TREM|nr:uncharacterized protein DEA37_0007622 [Paragonimus westermani]
MQVPDVWDMALDLQSSMVEAIVSLSRETMPRWRQVLLGGGNTGTDGLEENAPRAVAGLTCTGQNPPGGPSAGGGDMIMLGVTSQSAANTLSLVGGPASGLVGAPGVGTGVLGVSAGNLSLSPCQPHAEFGSAQSASGLSIRGIAGVPVTGVNANTEVGELSLVGRYSDEDHKVVAIYGALLVGEKCRPRECLNVELLTRITAGIFNWFLDTIYTSEDLGLCYALLVGIDPYRGSAHRLLRTRNTPQILTSVEVPIPMKELLTMFRNGVESFQTELLTPEKCNLGEDSDSVNFVGRARSASGFRRCEKTLESPEKRKRSPQDKEHVSDLRSAAIQLEITDADIIGKQAKSRVINSPAQTDEEEQTPDETKGLLSGKTRTSSRKVRKHVLRKRIGTRNKSRPTEVVGDSVKSGVVVPERRPQSEPARQTERSRREPAHHRRRKSVSKEYRITDCLAQMLNIAFRQCGIQCLEFQFDTVAADRCLILQSMHQLSCTLSDRQVFTWDFFVNRFGLLALQAQMSASGVQDMDTVTDLNGYHKNSQHFQIQFERACFVVSKSSGLPSIRQSSKVHNLSNRLFAITSGSHNQSSSAPPMSAGSQSEVVDLKHSKISSFKQPNTGSVEPSSRGEPGAAVLTGGEFLDGSNKFLSNIRNALDQDSQERDTLHQWVRLLLKFMANVRFDSRLDDGANSGPASNAGGGRHHSNETSKDELRDRKALSKAQRHLAFLLGYSDGVFTMPPYKMRNSTVFHSFLAHVGSVLDRNFSMGTYILHQTLVVLQFCASPQRYATDSQPPTFTLRLLEPHVRWYWLQTLLVILYKYEYNLPGGSSSTGGTGPTGGINTSYTTGSINHASSGPLGCSGGIGAGASSTGHVRLRKHSSEPRLLDPDEPHRTPAGANVSAALIGQSGPGPNLVPAGGAGGSGVGIAASTMFAPGHHHFAGPTSTANLPSGGTRGLVEYLIQIVLNTLDAHVHVCREQLDEEPFDPPSPPLRLREASNVSADFTTILETDTPPASPTTLEQHTEDEVVMPGVTVTLICPEQEARQRENEGSKAEQEKPRSECLLETRRSYETKRECVPLLKGTTDSSAASDSLNSPYSTSLDKLKREDCGQAQAVISPDVSAELTTSKPPRIKYLPEQPKHSMSTDIVTDSPGRLAHPLRESESRSKLSSGGAGQAEVTSHKLDRKKVTPSKKSSVPQSQTDVSRSGSTSNVALTSAAATAVLTTERCPWCHQILERYDESTLGLGMLCLATFVHREPGLAAPYLRDMLLTAARLANTTLYSWQSNQTHIIVPGNVSSIARQFLRCTMYNLAPNGLFPQLFQTPISDDQFFKCIISVLVDFEDHMSFFQPVLMLLEAMNKRKTLPTDTLPVLLENLANYLEYLPNLTDDVKVNHFIASGWTDVIGPFEVFLRKLAISVPVPSNLATTVRIMTYILRSPVVSNFKTLPDTFSAILRLIVENVHFRLSNVIELCSLSNRVLKERTKIQLSKTLVELFHQAIKFRASIPDENLIKLLQVKQSQKTAVQLNLNGCNMNGGSTSGNASTGVGNVNLSNNFGSTNGLLNSNAGMSGHNQHMSSATGGGAAPGGFGGTIGVTASIPSLHEDVLGAHLKSGLAQYVSLELSRSSSCSDQDVLTVLAPGLLVDVRPVKTTGFAVSSRGGQRLKPPAMCTNPSGPILSPGATATSGQGTELHSTKSTRSSGSLTSRQSDDIGGDKTHRGTNRTGDQTVIVITPSADTTSTDLPTTAEPGTSRTQGSTFFSNNNADSQGLSALTPATSGQSLHPDSSSTHSPAISNSSSLTVPPGAPGGNSPRLGHITLAPTFSQSSQIDAPVLHLLPWLKFTPPSSQLGPRDFLVMVERVRTLSWLLLGATMNMALTREATGLACRPIPFMLVRAVADLVKALLSSFPDQQKVWTVYCEAAASLSPSHCTQHKVAIATAVDFWRRIMPTILSLLSISDDLPGNMSKRLQKCIEWEPPEPYTRLLLLLSLPETSPRNRTGGDTKRGGGQNDSSERTQALNTTTPTLPGLTASSLLACQANTLMGCSPLMKTSKGPPEEGIPITGGVQCVGHALASSAPYSNDGVGTGVGIGAGALGADLLTSRLVAWLKKHIFVLGRNEDQHSTATHIFVH